MNDKIKPYKNIKISYIYDDCIYMNNCEFIEDVLDETDKHYAEYRKQLEKHLKNFEFVIRKDTV